MPHIAEYDTMQKLGITDSKQFLKRRLKEEGESLIFLQTCCVGKAIQDHVEAVIDEALTSGTWVHTRVYLIAILINIIIMCINLIFFSFFFLLPSQSNTSSLIIERFVF